MKEKYLFYFCDGIPSVFDSQVVELLNYIESKKYFKKIFLVFGKKNKSQISSLKKKNIAKDISTLFYKSYPNYPFFNFLTRINLYKAIIEVKIDFSDIIFHTRGELIAWHLSKIIPRKFGRNIIVDIRGAGKAEINEYYTNNKILKYLKKYNYYKSLLNIKFFNNITTVSDSLKKYIIKEIDIDKDKIAVVPCLAGNNFTFDVVKRLKKRLELNLNNDEILFVFSSGGNANWQNTDIVFEIANKGFKILNLSKRQFKHENIINKFVNHSEVPDYLSAADIALIWRDDSIVNKVASPVKFSEYLNCGLPIVSNKNVDLISDIISRHSCGILYNRVQDIKREDFNNIESWNRKKISELGKKLFGIDNIVIEYLKLYLHENINSIKL